MNILLFLNIDKYSILLEANINYQCFAIQWTLFGFIWLLCGPILLNSCFQTLKIMFTNYLNYFNWNYIFFNDLRPNLSGRKIEQHHYFSVPLSEFTNYVLRNHQFLVFLGPWQNYFFCKYVEIINCLTFGVIVIKKDENVKRNFWKKKCCFVFCLINDKNVQASCPECFNFIVQGLKKELNYVIRCYAKVLITEWLIYLNSKNNWV